MERYYFFILFGYLSGSILFARLLPKYLRHIDICELSEDNNPGVFNAFKHAGPVIGSMTLLLELAKGFLPVLCRAPAAGSPEHAVRPGTRRTGLRTCIPAVPAEGRRQVHRSPPLDASWDFSPTLRRCAPSLPSTCSSRR